MHKNKFLRQILRMFQANETDKLDLQSFNCLIIKDFEAKLQIRTIFYTNIYKVITIK